MTKSGLNKGVSAQDDHPPSRHQPIIHIAIGCESRQTNQRFVDLVINNDLFNFKGH